MCSAPIAAGTSKNAITQYCIGESFPSNAPIEIRITAAAKSAVRSLKAPYRIPEGYKISY